MGNAVEVKFQINEAKLLSKYKLFTSSYPEFPLKIWHWGNFDLLLYEMNKQKTRTLLNPGLNSFIFFTEN